MQEQIREIGPCSGADKGDVAERALQRAIEEYRLQRPELVRTEFHSRSLEGIAGQLEQEELRQEKRDRYIDQKQQHQREQEREKREQKQQHQQGQCIQA